MGRLILLFSMVLDGTRESGNRCSLVLVGPLIFLNLIISGLDKGQEN